MVSLLRSAKTSNTMSTPMYTTYNSRYPWFDENDYKKLENMAISTWLTWQAKTNFMDEAYQYYYPQVYNNHKLDERQVQINQNVAQNSNALLNGDKNTEWKMKLTDLSQRAKQAKGIAYDVDDMQVINAMKTWIPNWEQLILDYLNNGSRDIFYDAWIEEDPRKKLDENWWSETWKAMKTLANVPVDSFKKWGQRTFNEMGQKALNMFYKNVLWKVEDQTWISMNSAKWAVDTFDETVIEPMVQENVMNYQNRVNEEFAQKVAQNLDPDIKAYYDQKWYTKALMEWDFNGFWYKALWDAAENWEMPVVIAASVLQPELWFALMATDSYARENQEAFENMMNNGATYDQATNGAVAVWLINAAVEVWLEKMLWWVETTASNQIRKLVMKNVQEEAVKMWLWWLILEAGKNQLRSSTEEWLEEVVQQLVQNAFVKTVNENQELFEWLWTAFEWGFYNPMNVIAWGSNITQNISNGNVDMTSTKEWLNNFYNKAKEEVSKAYEALKTTEPTTEVEVETETTEDNGNLLDRVSEWWAEKLTNTASPQDKLYKAQEPRMNTLTKEKDLEKRRANSDRSNELIIENWYMPTDTSSRLQAHDGTMRKIWSKVEEKINGWKEIMIDQNQLADRLQAYVDKQKSLWTTFNESDIAQLEREIESLRNKQIDLPTLEAKKQFYNAIIKNWWDAKVSDTMQNGLKELTNEIWIIEDNLLSEIPGEFQWLKNDFGALADTYEDVFKADMKNQKKKWAWLTETYSRIEWLWDVANGVLWMFTWKGDFGSVAKWATKLVVWKALAKASDVDFLIEQGFKGLAEEMKWRMGDTNSDIDSTWPKESWDSYLQNEKSGYNTDADLTTNENAMETTQTNQSLIEDVKGMKVWDKINLTSDHWEWGIITKTEYGDYRMQPYYRFTEKLSPDERLYTEEDMVEYLQDYGDRVHYEYIDNIPLNYEGTEEDLEELRQTAPDEYERLMDEEWDMEQDRQDIINMKKDKEEQTRKDFQKTNLKSYMDDMENWEMIRASLVRKWDNDITYTDWVTVEKWDWYYVLIYDDGGNAWLNNDEVDMWLDKKEVKWFNTINPEVANTEESINEILDKEQWIPTIEEIRKEFIFEGYDKDDLKTWLQYEINKLSENIGEWQRYNDREAQHRAAINKVRIEAFREEIRDRANSPVWKVVKSYTAEELWLPPVSKTMLKNLDTSKYIPTEDPNTKEIKFFKVEDFTFPEQKKETKKKTTNKKWKTKQYADKAYSPSITMKVDVNDEVIKAMKDMISHEKMWIIDTSLYGRPRKWVISRVSSDINDWYQVVFEDWEEWVAPNAEWLIKDYVISEYTKPDFWEPTFKDTKSKKKKSK